MHSENNEFLQETLSGFGKKQKTLSPKWLYDDLGSALFEEITQTEDYYPTRTEGAIIQAILPELARFILPHAGLAEYGSGASVKTRRLIDALNPSVYVPIDIAADFLYASCATLRKSYPELHIAPVVADFTQTVTLPEAFSSLDQRVGFFPGSTIGNFLPEEAIAFMQQGRASLGDGAKFILGADLIKDTVTLERAYDDSDGKTAKFNLNLLTRMNRDLGANFNLDNFKHEARFNTELCRIEMHLVSTADQAVNIAGLAFHFEKDETIHTESSHKFTLDSIKSLAHATGWVVETHWTDPNNWFGVFLLRSA